jgi:predicted ATPase
MAMATSQETPYVFLSYASVDRTKALQIADQLESKGISIWIDRKRIAGGTRWSKEIVRGIRGCATLAVLSTGAALRSRNVHQEIQVAWEHDRPILPLRLEAIDVPDDVEYALAGRQWVEVLERPDADWLPEALRALRGLGVEPQPSALASQPLSATCSGASEVSRVSPGDRSPPHNLPAQTTSFIGRERELAEIRRLLRDRRAPARLITLIGAGGSGKTRLAIEVVRDLVEEFPDGVWLVELAPLTDPALVPQRVAATLGLRETPGHPILETLVGFLRHRQALLLVDNCEHLINACAQLIDTLLRSCARLQILATSREVLGVTGEATWQVPILAGVDPQRLTDTGPSLVSAVLAAEAVHLFVDRARLVVPSFTVTEQNALAVAQICWRLDGIPLAIELAAAQLRGLTAEEIVQRLANRFPLLRGGSRTALRHHQTLRALVDWSYDLLAEPERELLRRVSVFMGGFTLEAAESICVGSGSPRLSPSTEQSDAGTTETETETEAVSREPSATLDGVFQLVDKSLILVEPQQKAARYRLLEPIRQYAEEKLLAAGEATMVRERHRDYFLALAERAEPGLVGRNQLTWLGQLEAEHDNLRAALARSLEGDQPVQGLWLAACLSLFWRYRGSHSEGRRWLKLALERNGSETSDRRARGRALLGAGDLATYCADWREAEERLGESLAILRGTDDQRGIARALLLLGWVYVMGERDLQQALAAYEEALGVARIAGDQRGIGIALYCLGYVAWRQEDFEKARALYDESLCLLTEVGDLFMLSGVRRLRGWLAFRQGDAAQARAFLEDALAAFEQLGNNVMGGYVCLELAEVTWTVGDRTRSRQFLTRSTRLIRADGGNYEYDAVAVASLFARRENKYARAARLHAAVVASGYRFRIDFFYLLMAEWERLPDDCRTALGDAEFARVSAEGGAMTLEQAIASALEDEGT